MKPWFDWLLMSVILRSHAVNIIYIIYIDSRATFHLVLCFLTFKTRLLRFGREQKWHRMCHNHLSVCLSVGWYPGADYTLRFLSPLSCLKPTSEKNDLVEILLQRAYVVHLKCVFINKTIPYFCKEMSCSQLTNVYYQLTANFTVSPLWCWMLNIHNIHILVM